MPTTVIRETFKAVTAVYLVLIDGNKVLLSKRANTGYEDGKYSLPAGHVEAGESLRSALAREAAEEIGIQISEDAIDHALTMYRFAPTSNPPERMDNFFAVKNWQGGPKNKEPEKCSELTWFDINKLPTNTIPYIKHALKQIVFGNTFCEYGFQSSEVKEIGVEETLPLRSKVLRWGWAPEKCRFPEDGQAGSFHLGYFENGELIGIASFYQVSHEHREDAGIQLRGMAVDPEYQGKGIGKAIVQKAFSLIAAMPETSHIWCNARKVAYEFYQSQGFEFVSEEFDIPTVGPHRIMLKHLATGA